MKKVFYRLQSAFICLFYSDVLILAFRDKMSRGTVITVTDSTALDTLGLELMKSLQIKKK